MIATPLRALALAASLFLAACLGPGTPEEQLEAIQVLQAKDLPVTEAQKTELEAHIDSGRKALEGGDKAAAAAAFDKALAILNIAEDAAIFNKAD